MTSFQLSDALIEVTGSDAYAGPDGPPGCQRCGTAYWYRIDGGKWTQSYHRTNHKLYEWLEMSENLADFLEGERLNC